jgi:hypothetical protein
MRLSAVYINELAVGDGTAVREYFMNPADEPVSRPEGLTSDRQKDKRDRLVKPYHAEELVSIEGLRQPFVVVAKCLPEDISAVALIGKYEVPERFRQASAGILNEALQKNPKLTNGSCISIRGWHIDDRWCSLGLSVKRAGYFDFVSTDCAKDVDLSRFDSSFTAGETLRGRDIMQGKAVPPEDSVLVNMLGVGFAVSAKGKDGNDYLVLVRRRRDFKVEEETIGFPGGTPEWSDCFHERGFAFGKYLTSHIASELHEELLLEPDEFRIDNFYFVKDFTRAPDILASISINGRGKSRISIEDVVDRCYGNSSFFR